MCKTCETKPVYEFTNQRKLCKNCFINWFQKKALYTIRKFAMIKRGDVISIKGSDYRAIALKHLFEILEEKGVIEMRSLSSQSIAPNQASPRFSAKNLLVENSQDKRFRDNYKGFQAKRGLNKIAITSTLDFEANEIVKTLIGGKEKDLKKQSPVEGKTIKPLYLFLDEEVLLYAKLKGLKFIQGKEGKDKISEFIDEMEIKHPEVKRAVVNSYLKLYN